MFKRRDATCLFGGKTCSYVLICIISVHLFLLALIFCSYLLPVSHARFRGSKTSKGRKSLDSLHIFTFGDMSISNRVISTHSLHVIPVLVLLWFLCLLWLVDVSVLSNLVYAGSSHPKPTQDHKVSICITVMCMRISCLCTYCLQEGLMSMKAHFLYLHLSL